MFRYYLDVILFIFCFWTCFNFISFLAIGEYTNKCIVCEQLSLSATHCGWPTEKQKYNLQTTGLSAYICIRCNYVQIDETNMISHLEKQHDKDHNPITSVENEYRKIVIIPPLRDVRAQADPNLNDLVQGICEISFLFSLVFKLTFVLNCLFFFSFR